MNRVCKFMFLIGIWLLAYTHILFAQTDTLNLLKPVIVIANRLDEFGIGYKTETIDSALLSLYSSNNLADILSNHSQLFIKSYGLGSLATSSFRGAGAAHTAVLWNGFNLQSPMNGLLDFSLIPVDFISDVKIQYGSSSDLWGTGAVGGTIHLNNKPFYNSGTDIGFSASQGSFGRENYSGKISISKSKWQSSLKIFHAIAENNFNYINTASYNKTITKQSNAQVHQYGILNENYLKINASQELKIIFWHQYNNRNIPPSMTQNRNIAFQKDIFYRGMMEWMRIKKEHRSKLRTAYFNDQLTYTDSLVNIHSDNYSQNIIAEFEHIFCPVKQIELNVGINNTFTTAFVNEYIITPRQNRTSLFFYNKFYNKKRNLTGVINLRKEFTGIKINPFVFSVAADIDCIKYFQIKMNTGRHYRLPTFNDLYWTPGGNINLKPEHGWNQEICVLHKHLYKKLNWNISATVFNRNIHNWIIWLPTGNGIWAPQNILSVWSRGLEYKLHVKIQIRNIILSTEAMYNYILSTNTKTAHNNTSSLNKQLIYTPVQNATGTIRFQYRDFSILYNHFYVGYRYTTSDNLYYLNPYNIGNIIIEKKLLYKFYHFKIFFQFNNIWNSDYQVIQYRPMPLYNYLVGITMHFKHANKTKKTDKNENN